MACWDVLLLEVDGRLNGSPKDKYTLVGILNDRRPPFIHGIKFVVLYDPMSIF